MPRRRRAKSPSTCSATTSICCPSAGIKFTAPKEWARFTCAAAIRGCGWRRSGTLNVAGIVGLGEACAIARREMAEESARVAALRDLLKDRILAGLDGVSINGSMERRLPNNLNLSFAGVEGEALLMGLSDIAVSSGSACTSATMEPSYVLKALGLGDDLAHSSIRFGLGRFNTREEIEYVAARVIEVVKKLRELSPLYDPAR